MKKQNINNNGAAGREFFWILIEKEICIKQTIESVWAFCGPKYGPQKTSQ